ncbi:MAG TPA: ABC transporter substrate-binding protein [Anaerolineales bacterium]|nr:ABC transporter substrate-binding protein [Anaerolineales bacterium]
MSQKRLMLVVGLVVALSMVLSGCGPSTTATSAPAATQAPAATAAPAATEAPTQAPPTTRHGGWLDEIDYSVVGSDSAISQVQAGAIDLFSFNLASQELDALKKAGVGYSQFYGGYYDIMFNAADFKDTTVLNPFADKKIREAMNWAIDRNYVNQEIYGGGSLPKFFAITTNLVDYTGVVDTARALETKYAFNLDKAKEVVTAEMGTLGATAGSDGKWQFNGKPVNIIFLIRSDGDGTRKPLGDYVANQMEALGFTVDRQYKKSSEASPIWIGSDPADGKWNAYTAGWLSSGLTRDEKQSFSQMYAPNSIQSMQFLTANTKIDPEFQKVCDDLNAGNFTTLEQRHDLMVKAMELSMQDSLQVWVIDQQSFAPYAKNVQVTYDLASGIEAAAMNPYNMRFTDKEGGAMKVGTNDLFTEPWNTVNGDNWIWDTGVMRATMTGSDITVDSGGIMGDPYTGLAWPQRIDSAEVTVQTGLPVQQTNGWVKLSTADKIDVPPDTWVDWDAKTQKFVTAAEKFPDGTTAKVKSVVVFPKDLFQTVKWHDGAPLSVADFVMPQIEFFDRASKDSKIYDESAVPNVEANLQYNKGFRITSTDPLTIESYSDLYTSDAELDVVTLWPGSAWGLAGEQGWDVLAVSNLAEANGELAFSPDKADAQKVEQTSWVGGPSLDIMAKHLDEAISQSYIPYAPTMSQFLTADQAKARYTALKDWYTAHGHFWVGTGPYFLDKVFTTEKTLTLKNNTDFPDLADRWAKFSSQKMATAALDGPAQVKVGDTATFDVTVTLPDGSPYANADVAAVKYLLYDPTGAVISTGEATAAGDGHYQVVLGPDVTGKLVAGSDKVEVAVVPIPVAIPSYASLDFVVVP